MTGGPRPLAACASSGYAKAVHEPEGFGERVEQERLDYAAAADEQERVFGDEGRENRGREKLQEFATI